MKYVVSIFLGLLSVLFFTNSAQASIGVSPGTHIYDFVLQNTEVTNEVILTRKDASEDEVFKVTPKEEPISEDVLVPSDGDSFVFPKGERFFKYQYKLRPGSLPSGDYFAYLQFNEVTATEEEGSQSASSTLQGTSLTVKFTVVNYSLEECEVPSMRLVAIEENTPISLEYTVLNKGNVDIRPSKIDIKLLRPRSDELVFQRSVSTLNLPLVGPFGKERFTAEVDTEIAAGVYVAEVDITCSGETFSTTQDLEVFPEGTFDQSGELLSFDTDKEEYFQNEIVTYTGVFRNTGSVQYKAELNANTFKGDSKIDFSKTEPLLVKPREEVTFEIVTDLSEPGDYLAQGDVTFGSKKTDKIDAPFRIVETSTAGLAGLLSVLTLLFGLIIFLFYRRRKDDDENQDIGAYCEYDPYSEEGAYCKYDPYAQ